MKKNKHRKNAKAKKTSTLERLDKIARKRTIGPSGLAAASGGRIADALPHTGHNHHS